nr:NADH dehydrogenase subunit 6 [Glyphocassis sp. N62]
MPCIIFIMILNLTLSFMFMIPNHPIYMMIIILLQTIMICLLCGMMINIWWFSYMTFMVMVGGLLILFMYMTNTASNEKFKSKKIKNFIIKMMLLMLFMSMMMKDKLYAYLTTSNWMNLINNTEMEILIMKYYNYPSNTLLFMMMIYLLMTLIMTVKMTDISKGALRQKF